jgi:hypothetical protein
MESRKSEFDEARQGISAMLSNYVVAQLSTVRFSHPFCNGIFNLLSKQLQAAIKNEISDFLSEIAWTDVQNDIMKRLNDNCSTKKGLKAFSKLTPFRGRAAMAEEDIHIDRQGNAFVKIGTYRDDGVTHAHYIGCYVGASGWCQIYRDSMKARSLSSEGYTKLQSDHGSKRKKMITYDFIQMLARAANTEELKKLKEESLNKKISSTKTLRYSHGFFTNGKDKKTKRFKEYTELLDNLDQKNNADEKDSAQLRR